MTDAVPRLRMSDVAIAAWMATFARGPARQSWIFSLVTFVAMATRREWT